MRSIDLFRSSSNSPSDIEDKPNQTDQAKCILSVMGNSQNQSTVGQALESIGVELVFVTSGEAADEFLNKRSAMIVISEIDLPMMNGLSLARRIKEDASLGDIPVLLISDSTDGPDKVLGMETGADDYITMPINPSDLRSRVMALLARTKNEPEVEESADLNETYVEENVIEETVIGAGARSIPVDELGLGVVDLTPEETAEPLLETATEPSESAIIEELHPVTDLISVTTAALIEDGSPEFEESQPVQSPSVIVEEADPFNLQSVPQSEINVFAPIEETPIPIQRSASASPRARWCWLRQVRDFAPAWRQ